MSAGIDTSKSADLDPVDSHDFHLAVEPLGDDGSVIAVTGELDLSTVPALRGALSGAVERGITRLVVDLTAVTFVDSVGVGAILHSKRRLGGDGVLAVVIAPESYARVIFDVVGADAVVDVFETREAAVAHLGR
jgi:anti-sigma B factor antagonist